MTFAAMPVAAGNESCTLTVALVYSSGGLSFRGFALNTANFYGAAGGSVNAAPPFLFRGKAVSLLGVEGNFGAFTMILEFQNYPADGVDPGTIPFSAVYAFGKLFPASGAIEGNHLNGGVRSKSYAWDPGLYPVTSPTVGSDTQVVLFF